MSFRRAARFLLVLVNIFVIVLIVSYGLSVWRDGKGIVGEPFEVTLAGEGKVSAKPDVARINATVFTQRPLLKEAQEENSRKSEAVVAYLKNQGVEDKDIKTTGYNIYPQYSYPRPCYGTICPVEEDVPKIVGYQVRNSLEITVRDLAKAGGILSGLVNAGVNEVSGINFTIDQPDALRAEARKKAIDDASAKAEKLARDLGQRLGRIVSFSESGGFPPPIFLGRAEFDGKGGGGAEPAIQPGENEVIVNVSITYEFK